MNGTVISDVEEQQLHAQEQQYIDARIGDSRTEFRDRVLNMLHKSNDRILADHGDADDQAR